MEKAVLLDGNNSGIKVVCLRFGNLPWSTGSIFPIWEEMTKKNNLIKSTGPNMTRYFYSVQNACKLIDYTLENIKYLEADWTRKDADIAQKLEEFGRTGVPLYLLYPSRGEPIILPEILTEDTLVRYLTEIN